MKFNNKAKPIKFSLLVGGRECRSVEDVKRNFDFDSLYKNFANGNLQKWLKQIGESSLLNRIGDVSSADLLTKKVCLYSLFSPKLLLSDEVNVDNVLKLLTNGYIKYSDLSGTPFADNLEIKKSLIHNIDNDTLNRWCESDLEMLKYVYSNKSYDFFNAQNCRTLINHKIVTDEYMVMKIAMKRNLNDILERLGRLIVRVDGIDIEMILVKGYQGGNFYIGKYPVTQAQWQAVMGYNPSSFKGADNPVEQVSWYDCQDFIKKLNSKTGRKFRLPKEAEWEFAARGGNKTHNYTYSGSNNLDEVGWYDRNSNTKTHPVGLKKPNELGIYDMSGNVSEWCEESSGSKRIVRGGSWINFDSCCTVSCRDDYYPDSGNSPYGFRLVMDVKNELSEGSSYPLVEDAVELGSIIFKEIFGW